PATCVQEEAISAEQDVWPPGDANDDGFWACEGSLAVNKFEVFCIGDAALAAGAEGVDDISLAFAYALQGDADGAGVDAVIGAAAGKVGDAAAGNHCFGGRAAFVDASAADVNLLDQKGAMSSVSQGLAKRRAALAGADHDRIVVCGSRHTERVAE